MRKALLIIIIGLTLVMSVFVPTGKVEVLDRIVAVVNGDIITMQEIDTRLKPVLKQNSAQSKTDINQIRRQILELLIERKLIEQESKKLGISVSEKEVDQAIERIKKLNSVTQEEFEANVDRMGMTIAMVRSDLYMQLSKMKLINREMRPRIIISDNQIEAYYRAHIEEFQQENKVHLKNIQLQLPPNASEAVVQQKLDHARKIIAEIKKGRDFSDAAREYSKGPNAAAGGDMGLVAWDDMSPEIRKALEELKDGGISEPVRLGQTIQILKIVARFGSSEKALAAAKKRIQEILVSQELAKKYQEWLKTMRAKSIIKIKF